MAVSFKKLFHLLVEKNMSNAQLRHMAGFSANIMTRIKHDKYVSLESLEHICRVLECRLDDILEFYPDDSYEKREENAREYVLKKQKKRHHFRRHKRENDPVQILRDES
ncbi:MAG: hypothetical protein CW338_05760 [Clostridiales bacterium]|nr:hypothetical protein [Clostridiales bacterium]